MERGSPCPTPQANCPVCAEYLVFSIVIMYSLIFVGTQVRFRVWSITSQGSELKAFEISRDKRSLCSRNFRAFIIDFSADYFSSAICSLNTSFCIMRSKTLWRTFRIVSWIAIGRKPPEGFCMNIALYSNNSGMSLIVSSGWLSRLLKVFTSVRMKNSLSTICLT